MMPVPGRGPRRAFARTSGAAAMWRAAATIAILPAAGCPARYPDYRVEAMARRLHRCAHGHADLRDVPMVYGLLAIAPAFQRKIDNLEVWPGGCWTDGIR